MALGTAQPPPAHPVWRTKKTRDDARCSLDGKLRAGEFGGVDRRGTQIELPADSRTKTGMGVGVIAQFMAAFAEHTGNFWVTVDVSAAKKERGPDLLLCKITQQKGSGGRRAVIEGECDRTALSRTSKDGRREELRFWVIYRTPKQRACPEGNRGNPRGNTKR